MISHFVHCIKFTIKIFIKYKFLIQIEKIRFSKWCETQYDWLQCIEWLKLAQVAEGICDQGHAEEKQPPSCCWGIYLISQSNSFFTRIFTSPRSCRVEILCRALSLLLLTGRVSRAAPHARFCNTKYVVFLYLNSESGSRYALFM